eukprot:TRINITY_DN10515_c0_g1_i8.p1 TRINITY_DN10515_c0_g1~~TRINITY_DN10515_c0_g1_i8.p1  ORF type:complete len:423 (+),score=131.04 TRINITY_DN10515_c0_g1_i8:86-1270(+)
MSYAQGSNPYGPPQGDPYGAPGNPLQQQFPQYGQGYPEGSPPPPGYPAPPQGGPPMGGPPPQGYPPVGGPPQSYAPGGAQPGYAQQQAPSWAGGAPQQPYGQAPMAGGAGGGPESIIAGAAMLGIKQKVSIVEALGDVGGCEGCCEKENEYEVYDQQHAQMIFYVKEKSELCGCTGRCCCQPAHELTLEISQGKGQPPIMQVERPFKCCQVCPAWMDCCRQEATLVVGGQTYGGMQQPTCGGGCKPQLDIKSGSLDSDPFAIVRGPCCCFGGITEMCCDQDFPVLDGKEESDVAQITKERPEGFKQAMQELMTDSDIYTLKFKNPSTSPKEKLLLLASVLLLDYMFFEENKPWECNPIEQSCSVTCFNWYICGCLLPCTVTCSGSDDGGGGSFD